MNSRCFSSRIISIVSVIVDIIGGIVCIGVCIRGGQVVIVYRMIGYIVVLLVGIVSIVRDILVIDVVNSLVVVGVVVSVFKVVVSIVEGIIGGFIVMYIVS